MEISKKHPIYVSRKCWEEKYVDLLLIEEKGKRHYVLIKKFNTIMYNHVYFTSWKKTFLLLFFASF